MSTEYTLSHTLMGNTTHIPEVVEIMQTQDTSLSKDNYWLNKIFIDLINIGLLQLEIKYLRIII